MNPEQIDRLLDALDRIADSLEALSELAIDAPTLVDHPNSSPALLKALDHIADMSGIGK